MKLLLLCALFSLAHAHSRLNNPAAFSTRESKNSPCGNGNAGGAAKTKVTAGTVQTGEWQVTAGDGNGPVTYTFKQGEDTAANNAAFTITGGTATSAPQSGTGTYTTTWTAPTDCGPTSICTVQFKSTSGWYSCALLELEAAVPTNAPTTAPPTLSPTNVAETRAPTLPPTPFPTGAPTEACEVAANLNTCSEYNGMTLEKINSPPLTLAQYETNMVVPEVALNLNNLRIYRETGTPQCQTALKSLVCARTFNPCLTVKKNICTRRCQAAERLCDLSPMHEGALGCDKTEFSERVADDFGPCGDVDVPTKRWQMYFTSKRLNADAGAGDGKWEPNRFYFKEIIRVADVLTFNYDAQSDVHKFPNEVAYNNCDFSQAEKLSTDGAGTFEWIAQKADVDQTFYFGSKGGASDSAENCLAPAPNAQKLAVEVSASPEESRPAEVEFLDNSSTRQSFSIWLCLVALLAYLK